MVRRSLAPSRRCAFSSIFVLAAACGGTPEPGAVPPPPPPPTPSPVAATPPTPAPTAAKEPTAEEKKKAEDAQHLKEDRAKWEEDHRAEVARWNPELHSEAKALADKNFPTGKAAISAMVAGKHRKPGNA